MVRRCSRRPRLYCRRQPQPEAAKSSVIDEWSHGCSNRFRSNFVGIGACGANGLSSFSAQGNIGVGTMARRLPSLNGLRAFEAAGRHASFTAAANELNVTQTAVSRMVRLLEQRLGFALFRRH